MKNQWDERYESEEFFYGTSPNTFLVENAHFLAGKSQVLSLGDGEGRNSVFLAEKGHMITALDLSSVGLGKMLKLANLKGVKVTPLIADLAQYEFRDNAWDCVVSIWCHLPSQLRSQVHKSVKKSLRSGGIFVLEAYRPEQLKFKTGGPQDVNMLVTLNELTQEFKEFSDFEFLVARETNRDIQEGKGHIGESAVVQFVARKK